MGRVYSSNDDIYVKNDAGKTVWSSLLRPVNLMGDAYKLTVPLTISFPHMPGGIFYAFGWSSDKQRSSCASFQTIYPGEWGPGKTGAFNLPDTLLGALPAGANMLDVTITLTRTSNPSLMLGDEVVKIITEGVPLALRGNSCQLEVTSVFRRMIDISIIGSNIYLRRYQSVFNGGDPDIWTPDNSEHTGSGGIREGWTWSGSPNAQFASLIMAKGPTGNVNKNRSGSNKCSLTPNANFASTWKGTAVIIPGRYNS